MIFLQVVMKLQKNHRNQIKKNHGKLQMFIKHQVLMMMMMMKILIINDLGR